MAQWFSTRKVRFSNIPLLALFFILFFPFAALSQHSPKIPFPYGPMGLNSMPWIVAKEANLFEKNGLNIDMIFVGVSTVMVQSMLSGSANVGGLGGPAVVSNVLRGGDIIQIAATVPYFTQSLMVRPQITEIGGLRGKKVGITRFGAVTDLALRALLERNNIKDVTILQMGGLAETMAGLSKGSVDGSMVSPPHNFTLLKQGFREIVSPKGFEKTGDWLFDQWGGRQKILCCRQSRCRCPHDQSYRRGDKADDNQRRFDEKVDLEVPPYRRPRVAAAELSLRRRELCPGPHCATGRDAMDGATARTDESGRCQGAAEHSHLGFLRQQLRRGAEAIGVLRKSLEVSTG